MASVITVHSFRRAAGRSSLAANLSALLAWKGYRVAVLDIDFQSPSLHLLFDLPEEQLSHSLNDYLWDQCQIQEAVYDMTARLDVPSPSKLYLLPSSPSISDIMRMLTAPYDFEKLNQGLSKLGNTFDLDYLVLDSSPGLNEDTLPSIALSNTLVVVMRPDQGDYQGTAVTVEVVRNLGNIRLLLVLNDAPQDLDLEQARLELETTYQCEVSAVLPHSEGMMALASRKILALHDPMDPYVIGLAGLLLDLTGISQD